MHKILYVARKAKWLTELQLSKLLQIDETEYKELEYSLKDLTADLVTKLSRIFDIEPEYFLLNENRGSELVKIAMDEVTAIIKGSSFDHLPPSSYFSIIALGNKALLLQTELNTAVYKQLQLTKENELIKTLYSELKEEKIK